MSKILVIDDERAIRNSLKKFWNMRSMLLIWRKMA